MTPLQTETPKLNAQKGTFRKQIAYGIVFLDSSHRGRKDFNSFVVDYHPISETPKMYAFKLTFPKAKYSYSSIVRH